MSEIEIKYQCWQDGRGDMEVIQRSHGNGAITTPDAAAEWYVRRREGNGSYGNIRPLIGQVVCVYDGEKIFRYRLQLLMTPLSAHDPKQEPFVIRQSLRDGGSDE